jgi:SPASM domain peptide maturase of grasp-with-spasm system
MYFLLYAHNIPVAGEIRSAIYDLQHAAIVPIPNVLYRIIEELRTMPVKAVKKHYTGDDNGATFDKYIGFLLKKDLGFFTAAPEHFPLLPLVFKQATLISNAILEYKWAYYNISNVIAQLHQLLCKHLELRLQPGSRGTAAIEELLSKTDDKCFRSITLFLNYHHSIQPEAIDALYESHPKLSHIFLLAAPFTTSSKAWPGKIVYSQLSREALDKVQQAQEQKYVVNTQYFTEARLFNTYFNGKIYIDEYGCIRNAPQQAEDFGHADTTTLSGVIQTEAFRQLWHAGVDKIKGINKSPLRYAMYIPKMLKKTGEEEYEILNTSP